MVPEFTQQLLNDAPLYQGTLILFISLLLSKIAPLPRAVQPLVAFNYLAKEMASKVNHSNRSHSQQVIAGALSAILLVVPFWAIITFLLQLAAFPWFFEFLVLYICLNDENFNIVAEEVNRALNHEDKTRARKMLAPWLTRDTQELSDVGLSKATIEKLVTTPVYGTVASVLFFILGGAPLVLAARMLKQLELCWLPINPQFRYFSRPVFLLNTLLFALPTWLWNLSLAIQGGPKSLARLFKPVSLNGRIYHELQTCSIAASVLNIELGGPMKFNGVRVNTAKLSHGPLPEKGSIREAIKLARVSHAIWVGFVVVIPMIWAGLRYLQVS
ncbi:cobalamin biosynthesis protein CobD/CbiB [Shewanella nanhaiensis]|uniref:Cobalamin biosynthesis protein n=1 Tax=Shewanella nanhaiensis TaxID=2864872 RepID=A0ABS7E1P7_9GAMM|nr:cobalamin biosynthesis protein [Shewanella nanhaiensis]MBW8183624.1 cobalamin biosynthesis protein [Shewanella nanhaiensis]